MHIIAIFFSNWKNEWKKRSVFLSVSKDGLFLFSWEHFNLQNGLIFLVLSLFLVLFWYFFLLKLIFIFNGKEIITITGFFEFLCCRFLDPFSLLCRLTVWMQPFVLLTIARSRSHFIASRKTTRSARNFFPVFQVEALVWTTSSCTVQVRFSRSKSMSKSVTESWLFLF